MEMEVAAPAAAGFVHCEGGAAPRRLLRARREFLPTAATANNFTKGVRVSPDGLCVLCASDDRALRLFEVDEAAGDEDAASVLQFKEGGAVYDFAWYPFMTSADPNSCIFLTTSRDQPVHMWDAYTGKVGPHLPVL